MSKRSPGCGCCPSDPYEYCGCNWDWRGTTVTITDLPINAVLPAYQYNNSGVQIGGPICYGMVDDIYCATTNQLRCVFDLSFLNGTYVLSPAVEGDCDATYIETGEIDAPTSGGCYECVVDYNCTEDPITWTYTLTITRRSVILEIVACSKWKWRVEAVIKKCCDGDTILAGCNFGANVNFEHVYGSTERPEPETCETFSGGCQPQAQCTYGKMVVSGFGNLDVPTSLHGTKTIDMSFLNGTYYQKLGSSRIQIAKDFSYYTPDPVIGTRKWYLYAIAYIDLCQATSAAFELVIYIPVSRFIWVGWRYFAENMLVPVIPATPPLELEGPRNILTNTPNPAFPDVVIEVSCVSQYQ